MNAMPPPQADRAEIDRFVGALFRHADPDGYVSLRAFFDDCPSSDVLGRLGL